MKRRFLKIGHRGHGAGYGENTMLSFNLAIALGANGIEYDVRKTKDDELVVIHDETIDHTTNGAGKVADYTYDELLRFNAGYEQSIPLFEDVLYKFHNRAFQNVEIKGKGIAKKMLDIIECYGPPDEKNVIVSAFDWDELAIFRETIIPTALLADADKVHELREKGFILTALTRGAKAVNPHFLAVTASLVKLAHEAGLKIYPWTVDDPGDIARMKELDVDGIISNYPERL